MMKTLILGALPRPAEGPWVGISEQRYWVYNPKMNYQNRVEIQVREFAAALDPLRFGLKDHPIEIHGFQARVVIVEAMNDIAMVTIELTGKGRF